MADIVCRYVRTIDHICVLMMSIILRSVINIFRSCLDSLNSFTFLKTLFFDLCRICNRRGRIRLTKNMVAMPRTWKDFSYLNKDLESAIIFEIVDKKSFTDFLKMSNEVKVLIKC